MGQTKRKEQSSHHTLVVGGVYKHSWNSVNLRGISCRTYSLGEGQGRRGCPGDSSQGRLNACLVLVPCQTVRLPQPRLWVCKIGRRQTLTPGQSVNESGWRDNGLWLEDRRKQAARWLKGSQLASKCAVLQHQLLSFLTNSSSHLRRALLL